MDGPLVVEPGSLPWPESHLSPSPKVRDPLTTESLLPHPPADECSAREPHLMLECSEALGCRSPSRWACCLRMPHLYLKQIC